MAEIGPIELAQRCYVCIDRNPSRLCGIRFLEERSCPIGGLKVDEGAEHRSVLRDFSKIEHEREQSL